VEWITIMGHGGSVCCSPSQWSTAHWTYWIPGWTGAAYPTISALLYLYCMERRKVL